MDVDKVYKLFQIAEQALKFPHMSGKVLEWVRLQLIDVDKEITAEIEEFKAKVQSEADERNRAAKVKAKNQADADAKATTKPAKPVEDQTDEELGLDNMVDPNPEPAPLPRRL